MDSARWQQIEQIYHSALEMPPSERGRYVRQACAADPSLLEEVESLLANSGDADDYLSAAVEDAIRDSAPAPRKLGRYEIDGEVGRGGMGVVYRALDPAIRRIVAIKTIPLDQDSDAHASELQQRLMRESQAAGQLSHPNIVAIHDISQEGQVAYIVMEFVEGRTLEQILEGEPGPRPVAEALRIVQECAAALDYAHSRGVVHRDIKPANIMLQPDGAAKVADFGIARGPQLTSLTQSAAIVGSPQFMAPEQWKGEEATGRADQYSLAAVVYSMLTGHRPYEASTLASLAAKVLNDEPPAATSRSPALPRAVDSVLRKALAKNPAQRYAKCGEFAAALTGACADVPRRSRRGILLAAAATVLVAAAAGALWMNRQSAVAPLPKVAMPANTVQPAETTPTVPANASPPKTARAVKPPPVVVKSTPPPVGDPLARAQSLAKTGAYADAIVYFSQAIARAPAYAPYFGRAGAYHHLDRLTEAVDDYSDAIRLNPGGAMAYHERAICLARLNQDDRALADYEKAIELAPGYALSWNGRGMIFLHRKEYQKANSDFTEAIRLKPDFYQALKNRAAARKALGDASGAKADLDQANTLKQ